MSVALTSPVRVRRSCRATDAPLVGVALEVDSVQLAATDLCDHGQHGASEVADLIVARALQLFPHAGRAAARTRRQVSGLG
jgi:hypothetical protein